MVKYFKSRQAFAIDKFLSQCKGEYGLNLLLKNSDDIIAALKDKQVHFSNFPPEHKYGLIYANNKIIESFEFWGQEDKLEKLCFGTSERQENVA